MARASGDRGPRGRSIWTDGLLLALIILTVLVAVFFVLISRQILNAILAADPVFFAGLSGTVALGVGQVAYNRYHDLRIRREDSEKLIRTTDDPVLVAAIESRAASIVDRYEVDRLRDDSSELSSSLRRWHDRVLRRYSVFRELAVLRRNLDAAYERANDYFDAQAEDEEYHTDSDQFAIIIDEINKACGNALRVDTALRDSRHPISAANQGLVSMKLNAVGGIFRDLTEALERRNHVFETLFRHSNGDVHVVRSREFFRVMTSDLRKAHRTLASLLDRDRFIWKIDEFVTKDGIDPAEAGQRLTRQQYLEVLLYMRAAKARAEEAREALLAGGTAHFSATFEVLLRDIDYATDMLEKNREELASEILVDGRNAEARAERLDGMLN